MNNIAKIQDSSPINFDYFNSPFTPLGNINPQEAAAVVNSDSYIVKQAFHEYRAALADSGNKKDVVRIASGMLENDRQIDLFLKAVLAGEMCGQNLLQINHGACCDEENAWADAAA